ncbi:hypothetical protein F8388_004949 [Cannabis sativa]|uniref:Reverse transcriptase zinc-binding domain-containing protein n=1 Tax=Cannabis sativa TaxID=3483 RepID=A0A7J6HQ34_CANSA|nr:hypothetical protein F8388_004949 [Cannabis sativa]
MNTLHSRLLTRDLLARRHVPVKSLLCPVCEKAEENHSYLFFDCSFSKRVMESFEDWIAWANQARVKSLVTEIASLALAGADLREPDWLGSVLNFVCNGFA